MTQLFRMENVVTKRRDNINCDEEERRRMGYEIITGVRFAHQGGQPSYKLAAVEFDGEADCRTQLRPCRRHSGASTSASAAAPTKTVRGFMLDTERGYWAKNDQNPDDEPDPLSDVSRSGSSPSWTTTATPSCSSRAPSSNRK